MAYAFTNWPHKSRLFCGRILGSSTITTKHPPTLSTLQCNSFLLCVIPSKSMYAPTYLSFKTYHNYIKIITQKNIYKQTKSIQDSGRGTLTGSELCLGQPFSSSDGKTCQPKPKFEVNNQTAPNIYNSHVNVFRLRSYMERIVCASFATVRPSFQPIRDPNHWKLKITHNIVTRRNAFCFFGWFLVLYPWMCANCLYD